MVHVTHETLKMLQNGALWPKRHSNAGFMVEGLHEVFSEAIGSPLSTS